ncbi:conserved Plasmodium protein, unknown function [Plasmodium berghei]|uniref:Uncharacterized protein n=2 Tax=Plasmodium berghei TaxID=5821 RepID=A0A509AI45_PLABA|nr:conserved Plasmodium protein, unknown function [Plasmodium berghei ANKA]CXI07599.1 conserved Plasmodium protein, unknown function [Plasmodium berghei]SCL92626.1 conserved Plasmodium protein, unknown function [Plasmodium berghei]SCM15680.1 conserved Plasmodium protein, unknown function [Plasmodium berghei]SCM17474.1 conserved Plasmodium protein, unknown function [Plasmodium berghei]SCN22840.1 conserved Plasmodium protein, unknown function [Plasmodium berghei]|eukprot:XP_034420285.1 conserved Plasmodium protein, unknown function [Plasmodium berghei ANKA]
MSLKDSYLVNDLNLENPNKMNIISKSYEKCNIDVNKEFNCKMDTLIEFADNAKNTICFIQSQNKTKNKEVENEYLFLKKVGDVCKKSCDYYFDTNVNFHESCENFNVLFKLFHNSLVNIKNKNEEADEIGKVLKSIEEKEYSEMKENEEKNVELKGELKTIENNIHFMNNESVSISNKIKEIDYQINQHKEALESFQILTHLNSEKIIILQNDYKMLCNEKERIINEISEATLSISASRENLSNQTNEMESNKKGLLRTEKELKCQLENLMVKKNDMFSENFRLESQNKFLENQISSQEYYLNVINFGLQGTIKRRTELEDSLVDSKKKIENVTQIIEKTKDDKEEEEKKLIDLENNLIELEKKYLLKEEEVLKTISEENILKGKIEDEKKKINQNIVNDFIKEKDFLDEEINNYKNEINKLVLNEKRKMKGNILNEIHCIDDVDISKIDDQEKCSIKINGVYDTNEIIVNKLGLILENLRKNIINEQESIWKIERTVQHTTMQINELQGKINDKEKEKDEMDNIIQLKNNELISIQDKKKEYEHNLLVISKGTKELEENYNKQYNNTINIKNKLKEKEKNMEIKIAELNKEYDEKTKNLYNSKNNQIDINSTEKKKMKEDVDMYSKNIISEYELKKVEFEKNERIKYADQYKELDIELKKEENLLNYYKELLEKQEYKALENTSIEIEKYDQIKGSDGVNNIMTKHGNNSKIIDNRNMHQKNDAYINKYKLYNMPDQYKFGYFDATSPNVVRKSMKLPTRSVKSPHIARLLEKIKSRKECQTLVGTKKAPINQVTSNAYRRSRSSIGNSNNKKVSNNTNISNLEVQRNGNTNGRNRASSGNRNSNSNSFDLFQHL